MSNDVINTSYNPISLDHIFEDVDPLSEWLQEKENPLLDGENSGGDGQDSGTGGLSPIYDLLIGIEKNMGLVPLVAIFVTYQNSVEICSSSRKRLTSSNPGYTDSSTNTHVFIHRVQDNLHILNLHMDIIHFLITKSLANGGIGPWLSPRKDYEEWIKRAESCWLSPMEELPCIATAHCVGAWKPGFHMP
ncbi:hypothetical protein V6N12_066010 [Hibiscus sabdariffa]|uniref:Uncharacterized protein n=1 Tax=Hibiscus sabdariffa TaxID=183260 RepID=A0ABR2AT53_9ROSI